MTYDGMPYEEYKGFYLAPGITMPSAGVHDWNVYTSTGDVAVENPLHVFSSKEEAKEWVDEHTVQFSGEMKEVQIGDEVRITPEIDELRRQFYKGLERAHASEDTAVLEYSNLAGVADKLGYTYQRDALAKLARDKSKHREIVYQIKEKMPPPYLAL